MSFITPPSANSDRWSTAEHHDHLVIVDGPIELRVDVETKHGPADAAASAAVHCVDCATTYPDTLIFGAVLVRQLTTGADGDVLGRIGKGEASAGRTAPWVLEDPTKADIEAATRFLHGEDRGSDSGDF